MSQPETITAADWPGPPHLRPGLMRPRTHQLERLAEAARKANPEREPDVRDVVLARWPITELAELVALCGGAKLAMGVTKEFPAGQLGPGWTWWARHGYGQRGRDGRITESVFLRVDRAPRSALFLWSRPAPDPRLMIALALLAWVPWTWWPLYSWVLAQLPAPEWSSEYVTAWTTTATGRPEDIPRPMSSAAVKKEIRS